MACIKDSPNYWRSQAFPPSQAVLNFEQNWKKCVLGAEGGMEGKIARVVAGWRVEPQVNQKFVIRSRVLCDNYFKGFFHSILNSFDLNCMCKFWLTHPPANGPINSLWQYNDKSYSSCAVKCKMVSFHYVKYCNMLTTSVLLTFNRPWW